MAADSSPELAEDDEKAKLIGNVGAAAGGSRGAGCWKRGDGGLLCMEMEVVAKIEVGILPAVPGLAGRS